MTATPSHDLVRLEGFKARAETYLNELVIAVAPEDYRKLCEQVKNAGFDFPRCLSGTDMGYGLRTTLHVQRSQDQARITIRSDVPYDQPHLPSVSDLWGGVEWHERESYELVGIHYDNHPDQFQGHPRRLLLEDDWTIHPLQKRYDTRGYLMPDWQAQAWPSPAPHEDGFVAFAAAAPAAHAKPAPAAAPKAVAAATGEAASVAAPAAAPAEKKEPKRFVPAGAAAPSGEAANVLAPTSSVPESNATSSVPESVATSSAAPAAEGAAPKIKRWEPKGGAATEAPATGEAQGLTSHVAENKEAAPAAQAVAPSSVPGSNATSSASESVAPSSVAEVPAAPVVAPSAPEAVVASSVAAPAATPTAEPVATSSAAESNATSSVAESAPTSSVAEPTPAPAQDDLTAIEGIGPKRAEALYGAGLKTFVQLSAASTETLSSIMQGADLSLEPGIETWATQAEFLVRGDTAGFKDFTDRLVAGKLGKEKSPKIKRWDPKKEG